jgi:hypothetical protein
MVTPQVAQIGGRSSSMPKALDRIGCGHDLGELALEAGKGCLVHRFGIEAAARMRGCGIGDEPGLEAEVAGRSGCRRAAVVGREAGDVTRRCRGS